MRKAEVVRLLAGAIDAAERGNPYSTTGFEYDFLTEEERTKVEALQKASFDLWAKSWVTPQLKRAKSLVDGTISYPRRLNAQKEKESEQ
ncbi:MAG: hypothetical protein JRN62_02975 [Nitrososphaerota archaeon]|nr:hypothetical protein [Nitrososphaerota archaeon]MDG6948957.1 hypothetical protein [Nitrososphaerota archaeon]